jgi:hypothetical protein
VVAEERDGGKVMKEGRKEGILHVSCKHGKKFATTKVLNFGLHNPPTSFIRKMKE